LAHYTALVRYRITSSKEEPDDFAEESGTAKRKALWHGNSHNVLPLNIRQAPLVRERGRRKKNRLLPGSPIDRYRKSTNGRKKYRPAGGRREVVTPRR
jgi:hypothetical protein